MTARQHLQSYNWKSIPGPEDVLRETLPNGITILSRPNYNSPSVVMWGYLTCGSQFDPPEKLGLAQFTAASLMRGTQRRTFQQIYDELESAGASLGIGSSVHTTNFSGRSLADDLPLLLELASEALLAPAFPPNQVERLRTQILTGLAIRNQDTADMASLAFDEIVFPGHPYGLPEEGHPETIQAIRLEDLAAFHRQNYGPRSMVVVVVGGIDPRRVVDLVQQAFGNWENPEQPGAVVLPQVKPLAEPVRRHIPLPGKIQTDLLIGGIGPKRNSPDFMAASLGNNILGQFGMMGRIGDVVREQAGLAYYASTGLNSWIEAGSWEVSAGVNPSNLTRAIDLINSELVRFTTEPVRQDELEDSQSHFIGRLPLSLESNGGVAGALLNIERFSLGLDYYRRYPDLVLSLTPEEILHVAQTYIHPDRLAVVSSGPELNGDR